LPGFLRYSLSCRAIGLSVLLLKQLNRAMGKWEGPLVGGEGEGAAEAFDVADFAEADAEEVEVREGEHEAAGGELVEVA
jgi:hypothetical protein